MYNLSFIGLSSIVFFTAFITFALTQLVGVVYKNKRKTIKEVEDQCDKLVIGGVYGWVNKNDKDSPFALPTQYSHLILILDKKISPTNGKMYYKYIHINSSTLEPFRSYNGLTDVYSKPLESWFFESYKYVKDIDLNTINFVK